MAALPAKELTTRQISGVRFGFYTDEEVRGMRRRRRRRRRRARVGTARCRSRPEVAHTARCSCIPAPFLKGFPYPNDDRTRNQRRARGPRIVTLCCVHRAAPTPRVWESRGARPLVQMSSLRPPKRSGARGDAVHANTAQAMAAPPPPLLLLPRPPPPPPPAADCSCHRRCCLCCSPSLPPRRVGSSRRSPSCGVGRLGHPAGRFVRVCGDTCMHACMHQRWCMHVCTTASCTNSQSGKETMVRDTAECACTIVVEHQQAVRTPRQINFANIDGPAASRRRQTTRNSKQPAPGHARQQAGGTMRPAMPFKRACPGTATHLQAAGRGPGTATHLQAAGRGPGTATHLHAAGRGPRNKLFGVRADRRRCPDA
eukprot:362355-Chlamydomonas_euryale.AAC.10